MCEKAAEHVLEIKKPYRNSESEICSLRSARRRVMYCEAAVRDGAFLCSICGMVGFFGFFLLEKCVTAVADVKSSYELTVCLKDWGTVTVMWGSLVVKVKSSGHNYTLRTSPITVG